MIRNDLSHLPRADVDGGVRPDADPFIGRTVAAAWLLDNHSDSKPHAIAGTKFRFSMAGMCSRSLAYYFQNATPTNIPDSADAWRMGLGTMVHESVQKYFAESAQVWCPAEIDGVVVDRAEVQFEVPVHLPTISGSGSADMVIDYLAIDGRRLHRQVVELKTINGFGFKMSATGFKGPAQGPRLSHVQQAALCAWGLEADSMIICYLSMENVSPSLAASYCDDPEFGRFTAQWSYTAEDIVRVAESEMTRIRNVIELSEVGAASDIARRVYSDSGNLVDVSNPQTGAYQVLSAEGMVLDAGKTWSCGYCRYQDLCVKDG